MVTMTVVLQSILDGILIGGVYALIAVGLSLVFGVLRVVNFAHGDFLMVAMYIAFFATTGFHIHPYVTMLGTVPVLFVAGAGLYYFAIRPIEKAPELSQVLMTLGVSLLLQNLALAILKSDPRALAMTMTRFRLPGLDVVVVGPRLIAFLGAVVVSLILYWVLAHTDIGYSIRAASQNREAASLLGINVRRVYAVAMGIGIAVLGCAGALLLPMYYASPTIGLTYTLIAFVIVVLGGMGSILGAFVGGIIIAIAESLGALWTPGTMYQVTMYALFLIILFARPQGLLGGRA